MHLVDGFGRKITYLRFSVTPKCNFNCFYCSSKLISGVFVKEFDVEDMDFIFQTVRSLNFEKLRITGGEPLLREDIAEIVRKASLSGFNEIVLTSNGYRLKKLAHNLKNAGLTRVNVSLDTLRKKTFRSITQSDNFDEVFQGLMEAISLGLTPVKINTVLLKNINEDDLVAIASLSLSLPIIVRFIELMPVKGNKIWKEYFLSFKEALEILRKTYKIAEEPKTYGEVADYYRINDSKGKIGFITSVSQHFCYSCNRLRLSSSGKIYPCLFSPKYVDVWDAVKKRNQSDLLESFRKAVEIKPQGHGTISISDDEFIENMREIGG